jgi:hypothetical protein
MRTIPKENIYVSTHANVKSDELWNWKLFSLNSLVEEKYFFCRTLYSPTMRRNLVYSYLFFTRYLEKEEWKYCSMEISAL